MRKHIALFLVAACFVSIAGRASAQWDPSADDGFAPLVIGSQQKPTRWFSNSEVIYRSLNGSDNTSTAPALKYSQAVDHAVQTWNDALTAQNIPFSLSVQDWKPAIPDTTGSAPLTDPPLSCTSSPCSLNGSDTCIFKAYNPAGQYVCYTRDPATGTVIGETTFGNTGCTSTDQITRFCSLYVDWTRTPAGLSSTPTALQPVRDANGFIQALGNGRNELFIEEEDFANAVKDYAADPSATLALTVTRALIDPSLNYAQIEEADILINGDNLHVPDATHPLPVDHNPVWSTLTISGDNATDCAVAGTTVYDTSSIPESANPNSGHPLCYVAKSPTYDFQFDLQNVMTHEMGHLLGFGHPCDDVPLALQSACRHDSENPRTAANPIDKVSDTTMQWIAYDGQNTKRSLAQPDIDALPRVFGDIGGGGGGGGGGCDMGSDDPLVPLAIVFIIALAWRFYPERRVAPEAARKRGVSRRSTLTGLAVAAVLLPAVYAKASTVIPLSTEDLVSRAELVVEGVVTESRVVVRGSGAVNTEYHLNVLDVFMGLPPAELWVAVPGGQVGNQEVTIAGAPRFNTGDRAFFFLKHLAGRWIVVGLSQGAKPVIKAADGTLAVDAPKDRHVKTGKAASGEDNIGIDEFRAQVRSLVGALAEKSSK